MIKADKGVARVRKDYHIHPTILKTPERFDAFVQCARRKHIGEICVTDHMPLSLSAASDRIPQGRVGEYCRAVREAAKRYEGVIRIKCGIEIDFHPSVMSEIDSVLEAGDFDYILASSHMHIFIKDYPSYTFNSFATAALENSILAAQTGRFDAIAHPDMYRFAFENPQRFPLVRECYEPTRHEGLIQELLATLLKKEMCLEINPHLAESKGDMSYVYPDAQIAAWALEKNVRFSYGSDAHKPESVGACLDELTAHPVYGRALEGWEAQKGF